MRKLSAERLVKDEVELYYYGFSSTQLYLNYRDCINNRIKLLMVEVAKFYEQIKPDEVEETSENLLVQYNTFWAIAEQYLQKFYEDIQNILTLPEYVLSEDYQNPQNLLFNENVLKIEKDIKNLEEEYMIGKFYLESLKQCMYLIENKCLPLQVKVAYSSKYLKEIIDKLNKINILDCKRKELIETLETKDKKSLIDVSFFAKDFGVEQSVLNNYKNLLEQNTD
ncbi:uncharacterized protein LOC143194749 [Rhynchophorus ferrugineus]|uniref:Uncharacterized protein n=1 Tax=Rhynchophorus ferrugineus TaxID=354439 RepID=A0A834HTD9_RHYFE|nr:hypothetical protein GWI33_018601 [Rhynchophorus ferrugineus]